MKILFYGDSITDAGRGDINLGFGYVIQTAGKLYEKDVMKYEVINRGISGNRIVDLYARIKKDVWNEKPDVISILIGINDIWHELDFQNGVELDRFIKVYRMLIEDTMKVLPDTKIIICEPFVLRGTATNKDFNKFSEIREYARETKALADEFGLYFLPLQEMFDKAYEEYGEGAVIPDGVHPNVKGSVLIANEWIKLFNEIEGEI